MPERIRKNAVLCIEYLIAGSPNAIHEMTKTMQHAYFSDALHWLTERHGAKTVVCGIVHRDESTPHLSVFVIPIDPRGRLNCRHFLGGAASMTTMQTEFAERVGKLHGLSRGIEGSKAQHMSIRTFYALARCAYKPLPRAPKPPPTLPTPPEEPGFLATRERREAWAIWQKKRADHKKKELRYV
jgi:hypothetical protein